ncbi:MAG: phosphotransferase [Eggerthellaceae bacterium]
MITPNQYYVLSRSLGLVAGGRVSGEWDFLRSRDCVDDRITDSFPHMPSLARVGFVTRDGEITEKGEEELKPYEVSGAVILALGTEPGIFPFDHQVPKGLLTVNGQVLIEHQIEQLLEAAISDITLVVGRMREQFFYLTEKYGVKLVTCSDYRDRNDHAAILQLGDRLQNAYILRAGEYYECNPFASYVFQSTCFGLPAKSQDGGRVVSCDGESGGALIRIAGPVFLANDDADTLQGLIGDSFGLPGTASMTWDDFLFSQPDEFDLTICECPAGVIREFGTLEDLCSFDPQFILNLDPQILENIRGALGGDCGRISSFCPIGSGMTNLTFRFYAGDEAYVYRNPGNGTEAVVNRQAEGQAIRIAHRLGLVDSFVDGDASHGWLVSRYLADCEPFDYSNKDHVARSLAAIRTLHESGESIPYAFDPYQDAMKLLAVVRSEAYPLPRDFSQMEDCAGALAERFHAESGEPVLCHNDFYAPNILIHGDNLDLIDWEYAAMGDYANEIGNFVSQGSGYTIEQARQILPYYFGRKPTFEEMRHCMAAIGIVGFQWYVWALFKEMKGQSVGPWLETYYRAANLFGPYALSLY